jgi:hypothetical protein
MSDPRPHLQHLKEMERDCISGLVEVFKQEGGFGG